MEVMKVMPKPEKNDRRKDDHSGEGASVDLDSIYRLVKEKYLEATTEADQKELLVSKVLKSEDDYTYTSGLLNAYMG